MYILQPMTTEFNTDPEILVPDDDILTKLGLPTGLDTARVIVHLVYGHRTYALHCAKYRNDTGQWVTLLPPCKIPQYKFHICIYFYAVCRYLFDNLSLRAAAQAARVAWDLHAKDFSHTTLMRFIRKLSVVIKEYPIEEWMLIPPCQEDQPESDPSLPSKRAAAPGQLTVQLKSLNQIIQDTKKFRIVCEKLAEHFRVKYKRFIL